MNEEQELIHFCSMEYAPYLIFFPKLTAYLQIIKINSNVIDISVPSMIINDLLLL